MTKTKAEIKRANAADRQARHRERKKQLKQATASGFEYQDLFEEHFPKIVQELNEYVKSSVGQVGVELGRAISSEERYAMDAVFRTLHSFNRGYIARTSDGDIAGGTYFPDALGLDIVEAAHKFGLLRSQTFQSAYRELLELLDRRYGEDQTEHARAVRDELAGVYAPCIQPPEEIPVPEPEPKTELPSTLEILAMARIKTLEQIRELGSQK